MHSIVIEHVNLWHSLERKGINPNGKFLGIVKSIYSQLISCVKCKNGLTIILNVTLVQDKGVLVLP